MFSSRNHWLVERNSGPVRVAKLHAGDFKYEVYIGQNGFADRKIEGDGKTPGGLFEVSYGYWRADKLKKPVSILPFYPLAPNFGWCDDPTNIWYNRKITVPFSGSAENLWRSNCLYDIILVLNFNSNPVIPGFGSAIFGHLKSDADKPTAGCIAFDCGNLLKLLENVTERLFIEIR